jgi:hypothetical protein
MKAIVFGLVAVVGLGGVVGSAEGGQMEAAVARLSHERAQQIARLHDYRLHAPLPSGSEVPIEDPDDPHVAEGRAHTFIGPNHALCALAHLIAASGRRDLVDRLAREQNDVCIATTTDAELLAWVRASGLTLEECILIQEPGWHEEQLHLEELQVQLEERERELRAHLERVERQLIASTEASLRLAAARISG